MVADALREKQPKLSALKGRAEHWAQIAGTNPLEGGSREINSASV